MPRALRNFILYLAFILGYIYFYGPFARFDSGAFESSIQFVYSQF